MLPAHQRFYSGYPAGCNGGDGLIVDDKLAIRQRSTEFHVKANVGTAHVHGGFEDTVRAWKLPLGGVHGGIGIVQQLVGVVGVGARQGEHHPHACRHRDLVAIERQRLGHSVYQSLGNGNDCAHCRVALRQDQELVAS